MSQERKLKGAPEVDTLIARELTASYARFRSANPQDSLSPYYLIKQADLAQGVFKEYQESLDLYQLFLSNYTDHPMVPKAIFMQAYVLDEHLEKKELAIEKYQDLITNFPRHPLSSDARNLVQMMTDTLSEEEQVALWLERIKEDSSNTKNQ